MMIARQTSRQVVYDEPKMAATIATLDAAMSPATGSGRPRLSQAIGKHLSRVRQRRGLTRSDLAARFEAVGLPWTVDQIRNLEIGRRESIGVDELIALSVALAIPLSEWFDGDHEVDLTPKLNARTQDIQEWIWGDAAGEG